MSNFKVVTENPNGNKYLDAHKRWLCDVKSYKGSEPTDFKWDFVNSLGEQIDKGVPLTARQFKSLKRVCFYLKRNCPETNKEKS